MANLSFFMTPGSCSTAIHIILEELDEVFEVTIVNLPAGDHFKPDYVALNPKSTIPALRLGDGRVLTEVPVIAWWLGRSRPRAGLWPQDFAQETRALELMTYVSGTIHGQGFARIFTTPSFSRNEADQAAIRQLGEDIVHKGFEIVAATLPDEGYALGAFSVADPVLFYVEFWADKLGIALPPPLARHYRLMLERPVVNRVLREEGYDPARLGLIPG
ncbi:MAG: glutathione S-transferase family protein [Sphingobium sp.]